MASYNIDFQPSVARDVRHVPRATLNRILAVIESLGTNPLPTGAVKLFDSEGLYRVRVGDYRIVYEVDYSAKRVLIDYIRHRRDVYRRL